MNKRYTWGLFNINLGSRKKKKNIDFVYTTIECNIKEAGGGIRSNIACKSSSLNQEYDVVQGKTNHKLATTDTAFPCSIHFWW